MAGERGAAESARGALLGLLLAAPAHGYELARRFGRGSTLGEVIHLSPSHLYALLGRMERAGLIAGEQQEAGARPQRRVYRLTAAGRAALEAWLDAPVGHPRDMRIEFPLKFYIAHTLDSVRAQTLLARQRETFVAYILRLGEEPRPPAGAPDAAFLDLLREGRIGRARGAIEWLDRCAEAFSPVG